jgi:hypothetical protein
MWRAAPCRENDSRTCKLSTEKQVSISVKKKKIQHNDKLILGNLIYVSQSHADQFKLQLLTRYIVDS